MQEKILKNEVFRFLWAIFEKWFGIIHNLHKAVEKKCKNLFGNAIGSFVGSLMEISITPVVMMLPIILLIYPLILFVLNAYSLLFLAGYFAFYFLFRPKNRWTKFIFRLCWVLSIATILFAIFGGIVAEFYELVWINELYSTYLEIGLFKSAHVGILFKLNAVLVVYSMPYFILYILNCFLCFLLKPLLAKAE